MTSEEIHQIIASAPPGATIRIITIAIPESPRHVQANPADRLSSDSQWTAVQVVEWVQGTYGDRGLKLRDWASLLPELSVRELKRAVREGGVEWHPKSDGRDHGATMISPTAMLAYLERRSLGDYSATHARQDPA